MYIVLYCTLYDTISSGGRIRKDERGTEKHVQFRCFDGLYLIFHKLTVIAKVKVNVIFTL
jgi:hypothetical protein